MFTISGKALYYFILDLITPRIFPGGTHTSTNLEFYFFRTLHQACREVHFLQGFDGSFHEEHSKIILDPVLLQLLLNLKINSDTYIFMKPVKDLEA